MLLHLLELALVLAQQGQVVELLGYVRVVAPQDLGVRGAWVSCVMPAEVMGVTRKGS